MIKTKLHPLEICTLRDIDSSETLVYYSKGNHGNDEFIAEALKEHEIVIQPDHIFRGFMRWEMFSGPDGPCHVGAISGTPGRGKFPVTYCEEWEQLP